MGEAQHRPGNPGVGRGAVHPVRQVCAGVPPRGHPSQGLRPALLAGAPATFKSAPARWREFGTPGTRCRSPPRIAPAARCAWRSVRPRARARFVTGPSTWRRSRPCARRKRGTGPSSSACPKPTDTSSARSGKGCPASRAALRVLGRLRRLRRNTLSQARESALRGPSPHRERDWMLVDLRRKPADDAVDVQP